MDWLWDFIFGKKCPNCGMRNLDIRCDGRVFYYYCTWCFERTEK